MKFVNSCVRACAALSVVTAITLFGASLGIAPVNAGQSVNIYSYRAPSLIAPLLKAFTKKTGIKTNVVYAKRGLVERMVAEGAVSPVDILLTADIGRLTGAKAKGVTQAVSSAAHRRLRPCHRPC